MTGNIPILAVIGPTASGKSALSLAVARLRKAEIVSADSMQVYQGMDIGTAKPSKAEQTEIPHHLLDIVGPSESFSVARFVTLADQIIANADMRSTRLIVTGGTPLYFKALFEGLFDGPPADDALRQRLHQFSGDELHQQLQQVDAAAAARIDRADRKRLIRALEVFHLTGQPISSLQRQWQSGHPPRHRAVWIGLLWDRDELNRRINARVRQMIQAGWVEEVRALLQEYPELSKTAAEATGYRDLTEHVRNRLTLDDAIEQIKIATRQLARKQMKWFKRFPGVHWLAGNQPVEHNAEMALKLWEESAINIE